MRISFPVFGLGGAGGEKVIARVTDGLVNRGHEVNIVLPKGSYTKIYSTKANLIETPPIIRWYKKYVLPYSDFLTSCLSLSPRIPQSDIICATHCMTALPTLFSARLLKRGLPFYLVQHYEPLFFLKPYQLGYRWYAQDTYRHFENIITISQWLDNKVYEHTGRRSRIINPAVDLDIFSPREVEKGNTKTVLCLGVKNKWKGNTDVIKAMEIVQREYKNVKLVIVGRNPIKVDSVIPYEQTQASDEELAGLYSSCDVYVLGSWYEGFPAPPLEAMACRAPVVSTDNFGIREYGIDGKNCLIVPSRNPKAIADAILRLLSDEGLSQRFRQEGPETARQFTWDKMVDSIEKLFMERLAHEKELTKS